MKKEMLFFAVSFFLMGMIIAAERTVTPGKIGDNLVYFDAARDGSDVIVNRTVSWEKGNYRSVTEKVTRDGHTFAKFSYLGNTGRAHSTLSFAPSPEKVSGLVLTIDYPLADFGCLDVSIQDASGHSLSHRFTLRKGLNDYTFKNGLRRRGEAGYFDWNELRSLGLFVKIDMVPSGFFFFLEKISALSGDVEVERVPLPVTLVRKTLEIPLLASGVAELTGFTYSRSGKIAVPSPFSAKIAYDADNLYVATASEFPTPPQATVTKHDDQVYQDEAIEYFFCPANDNHSTIQLALNAENVAFDFNVYRKDGKWKRDLGYTLPFQRENRLENKIFHSKTVLPFKSLGFDLNKDRFMGFQLAQDYYLDRGDERLSSLCWAKSSSLTDAYKFGVLIFNPQPFGPGRTSITAFDKIKRSQDQVDFDVALELSEFTPGEYRLNERLVTPEGDVIELQETVRLGKEQKPLKIRFPKVTNQNGSYTLYLVLSNTAGNVYVFSANALNTSEPPERFGEFLLCPAPKELKLKKGVFNAASQATLWLSKDASERTRLTADLFKRKYYANTGIQLETRETDNPSDKKGVIVRVAENAVSDSREIPLKKEGYALTIDADRAEIVGADEPGLFYGSQTFFQLMNYSGKVCDTRPVPQVEILDWPDMPNRIVMFMHQQRLTASPFQEVRPVEYLMDWVDRMVAENKFNTLFLDVSAATRYKRRPEFNGPEKIYSLDDLARLSRFCKERFISLNPTMEVGGHADWWLLAYHPELREKGYKLQADVTKPEHTAILRDCMLDLIEAMSAKMASPAGDEWWAKLKPGETPDPTLNGKTRAEVFRDFQTAHHDWLAGRGVRMTMYEDMLNPYHNGKYQEIYKIVDQLPKDIIITWWMSMYLDEGLPWLLDKGFTVWCVCTGFYTLDEKFKNDPRIQGFGKTLYSFGNYLTKDTPGSQCNEPSYTLLRAADYAWNLKQDNNESLNKAIESGRLENIRAARTSPANPWAGASLKPIDISKAFNADFNAEIKRFNFKSVTLPCNEINIANIPTSFGAGELNCILLEDKTLRPIVIDGKFSALVFLHTSMFNRQEIEKTKPKFPNWRDYIYGYPFGQYIVKYEDGSETVLKLRFGDNILLADLGALFRDTLNCRYIFRLQAEDFNTLCLYQWEWANPFPEKKIQEIRAIGEGVYPPELFKTLLFAISGRNMRNQEGTSYRVPECPSIANP